MLRSPDQEQARGFQNSYRLTRIWITNHAHIKPRIGRCLTLVMERCTLSYHPAEAISRAIHLTFLDQYFLVGSFSSLIALDIIMCVPTTLIHMLSNSLKVSFSIYPHIVVLEIVQRLV